MVPNKEESESDSELTEEDATQPEQPEKPAEPAVENAVAEEPAAEEALHKGMCRSSGRRKRSRKSPG